MGIWPIFNVADLYAYKGVEDEEAVGIKLKTGEDQQVINLAPLDIKCILEKQLLRKTRKKEYFKYLVKWRNRPLEDTS